MEQKSAVIDGVEVDIERRRPVNGGDSIRVDVTADEERTWRLDVGPDGDLTLVASWVDDQLADVPIPDWMDELLGQLVMRA